MAFGALDAPNATLGAWHAPNATLGASGAGCPQAGQVVDSWAENPLLGRFCRRGSINWTGVSPQGRAGPWAAVSSVRSVQAGRAAQVGELARRQRHRAERVQEPRLARQQAAGDAQAAQRVAFLQQALAVLQREQAVRGQLVGQLRELGVRRPVGSSRRCATPFRSSAGVRRARPPPGARPCRRTGPPGRRRPIRPTRSGTAPKRSRGRCSRKRRTACVTTSKRPSGRRFASRSTVLQPISYSWSRPRTSRVSDDRRATTPNSRPGTVPLTRSAVSCRYRGSKMCNGSLVPGSSTVCNGNNGRIVVVALLSGSGSVTRQP